MFLKNPATPTLESACPVEDGFLSGDAEINALVRSGDWSSTPLGPITCWPQSLRTTIRLCLASNFPINIIWGPSRTQIYNSGFRVICGDEHPAALGMDFRECWAAAWPVIGPPFERALKGEVSFLENQRMFLLRNGYFEETFFTFSFSPIRDESGGIGGLFAPVSETTATMVGERRTRVIRDLTAALGYANSTAEVFQTTIATLSHFDLDVPFVLLYTHDEGSRTYRLSGATGVAAGSAISPVVLSPDNATIWPMARLLDTTEILIGISGLKAEIGPTPCGPYEEAPDLAFCVRISRADIDTPAALLMLGASARLPMSDGYRGLYVLIAAAFNAALTRVVASEKERKRLEALAALDRAKTQFFSNVSHEFRTPLTLMLGPLEQALATEGLPAALQEHLHIANRNALRLLKLVNSLLEFSRVQTGRNDASFVRTDISALTQELASNFESACEQAGLAFSVKCAPLSEAVYVDREMWQKIVLNLLSNAFKFTLRGGITVSLRERDDSVELEISDTGIGIPAADLPHIFERFYRVEGHRGRSMEGTGIGLSLVQELVHLHGGMIAVDTMAGEGSVFTVTIPLGSNHLPAGQLQGASTAPVRATRSLGYAEEATQWLIGAAGAAGPGEINELPRVTDQPRIVLADDNADMRAYIQRILEDGGYHVEAVPNGAAALAAVKDGPLPDLVLSDVMMPELDGFALLHALRSDVSTRTVIVILVSARAGEEARREGLAAGADDYIVKPFNACELRARIDGAIALARQRRESSAREQALLTEIETERNRAALRESEAHVATLFEQTAAGIAEMDLAGNLIRVNDRYCQIVGRNRHALIGANIRALLHPDDLTRNDELLDALIRTEKPFEVDNRFQRPDGSAIWVSKTVNLICVDALTKPSRILAIVIDITARKKAEASLCDTARRLEFTLDAAQIGDWDYDLVDDTSTRSLRHDQCFGYSEPIEHWGFEKMIGHVHPDDRAHVTRQFQAARSELKGMHFDCRVIWADQSTHWIRVHGSSYRVNSKPTRMIGTVVDITQRKEAENEIQNLAFFDPLTRLPNRRLLLNRLQRALVASARSLCEGALLFIDLDNFKTLNDTVGHQIGDQLLIDVAACLNNCVREGDTVARLGGDEFVVILEDLHGDADQCATQVEHIGEKILTSLNEIDRVSGFEHHTTASIGVTLFCNGRHTADELMKRADLAMYQAKAAGRNTLRFFDPGMQRVVAERAFLERELRDAISRNEFILYFQPQVSGKGELIGFEALARWRHPLRGMVLPRDFMAAIEHTALIFPFGLWVLDSACAQLAAWALKPHTAHLSMAVNVSAREFRQSNFVEQVIDAVRRNGVSARNLKLELTETVLLDDVDEAIKKMQALKDVGVRFSLDDFGVGYASLSYLKRLPFDQLKIDQSFIQHLLTDPIDTAIVKMVIELARSMQIAVVAEGVETKEQHDFLFRHGCRTYQGYLFSMPLSQIELDRLLVCEMSRNEIDCGTVLDINPGWNRRRASRSVAVERRYS